VLILLVKVDSVILSEAKDLCVLSLAPTLACRME